MEMTTPDGQVLLWPEQVADRLGIRDAQIVSAYLSAARKARTEGTATSGHLPEPYDRQPRKVPGGRSAAGVTVKSNRWTEAAIEAYLANRRGPGGRLASQLSQPEGD
jgi:hypothetical protein